MAGTVIRILTVTMGQKPQRIRVWWGWGMCACCGGILESADYLSILEFETHIVINLFLIICERRVRDL